MYYILQQRSVVACHIKMRQTEAWAFLLSLYAYNMALKLLLRRGPLLAGGYTLADQSVK